MNEPLTSKLLGNPESDHVMIIHFFLSMEPPFYAYLNKAIRSMDEELLTKVGPLARALSILLYHSDESSKNRIIVLRKGLDDGFDNPIGYFKHAFLVFKGVLLKSSCIHSFTN